MVLKGGLLLHFSGRGFWNEGMAVPNGHGKGVAALVF